MKEVTKFVANDGTEWGTKEEAEKYEDFITKVSSSLGEIKKSFEENNCLGYANSSLRHEPLSDCIGNIMYLAKASFHNKEDEK